MTTRKDNSDLSTVFVPLLQYYNTTTKYNNQESFLLRLQRAKCSQMEYENLFRKLNIVIDELKEKFLNTNTFLFEDDDDYQETISESSAESRSNAYKKRKRKNSDDFLVYGNNIVIEYPKLLQDTNQIIIGPNGTVVKIDQFNQILWETASATRSLLGLVFSNDILATHTLTGKPSPAFRGRRERPPKLQLDIAKTNDIIHCVRVKCSCHERDIRAVITTKCADTAKKYKRRRLARE